MPSEGMKSSTICISFCLLHPGSRLDSESKDDFKEPYLFCHASLLSSGHSREKLLWKYSRTVDSFTFTAMWINCIAAAYWLYRNKSLLLQLTQWQPADQSLVSGGDGCACLVSATSSLSHQHLSLRPPVRLPSYPLWLEQVEVKKDETAYHKYLFYLPESISAMVLEWGYLGLRICFFGRLPLHVNKFTEIKSLRNQGRHTQTKIWLWKECMLITENLDYKNYTKENTFLPSFITDIYC